MGSYSYQSHAQKGILLNANESPYKPAPAILKEIQENITTLDLNRYPDNTYWKLREEYSKLHGLRPEQVLVGNGSDQMLGLFIGNLLGEKKIALSFSKDFSMYDYYISLYGGELVKYPIDPEVPFDLQDWIQTIETIDPDLILFSNPNNPTGLFLEKESIQKILEAFPERKILVDEAYVEFAPESALSLIDRYPNLYVTRTLSKAFGLAGIRLGFLLSDPKNIEWLQQRTVPYSVNRLSEFVALSALKHVDQIEPIWKEIIDRRDCFLEFGKRLQKTTLYPSQANFILFRSKQLQAILRKMNERGIQIRVFPNEDYARITIGSEQEMELAKEVFLEVEREI